MYVDDVQQTCITVQGFNEYQFTIMGNSKIEHNLEGTMTMEYFSITDGVILSNSGPPT
tara:strand:+ start:484 stop:657 length:174 start_codon:yes stop_codon:yes gene_type:complete